MNLSQIGARTLDGDGAAECVYFTTHILSVYAGT